MRARLVFFATASTLAACAAVTGLGDYEVVDDGADGGVQSAPEGSVLVDGAVRPAVHMQCSSTISCEETCCFAGALGGVGQCTPPQDCILDPDGGETLPFTCDDPTDCLPSEVCCVQIYEIPVALDGTSIRFPITADCRPKDACQLDQLFGADDASAPYFSASEACSSTHPCPSGPCVPFNAAEAGADLMPDLRVCHSR